MSGVSVLLRQRTKANRRPYDHRSRTDTADVLRRAAVSMLNAAYCNDEMRDQANAMLEIVGDTLTLPRHGWYPQRPANWRP